MPRGHYLTSPFDGCSELPSNAERQVKEKHIHYSSLWCGEPIISRSPSLGALGADAVSVRLPRLVSKLNLEVDQGNHYTSGTKMVKICPPRP